MPHSVTAESEAPEAGEIKMEEDDVANVDAPQPAEADVDMADAASEPIPVAVGDTEDTVEPVTDASDKDAKKEDVKLEDLFADADSDDEFPSSRPAEATQSSSPGELTPTSR